MKAQATYIFGVLDVLIFAKDFFGLVFDFYFRHETGYFYETEKSFSIKLVSVILSKPSGWLRSEYLNFRDAAEAWGRLVSLLRLGHWPNRGCVVRQTGRKDLKLGPSFHLLLTAFNF